MNIDSVLCMEAIWIFIRVCSAQCTSHIIVSSTQILEIYVMRGCDVIGVKNRSYRCMIDPPKNLMHIFLTVHTTFTLVIHIQVGNRSTLINQLIQADKFQGNGTEEKTVHTNVLGYQSQTLVQTHLTSFMLRHVLCK